MKLDAIACKTEILHLSLVYLNGRLGWVPFSNKFVADGSEPVDPNDLLNFDKIHTSLCG